MSVQSPILAEDGLDLESESGSPLLTEGAPAPSAAGGSPTYTQLITSKHNQKPKFMAMVSAVTGAFGEITAAAQQLPAAFDFDQAVGAQLDILGLWIGRSRNIPNAIAIDYFGFSDNPSAAGFGDLANPSAGGPFFDLGDSTGGSAILDDGTYRTVLRAQILKNQYDGSSAGLEAALTLIAAEPYAIYDAGTQRVTIVILEGVAQVVQSLLTNIDVLPRPTNVAYCIVFPLAPWVWITSGTAATTANSVSKPSGAAGWDSGAYDITTYEPVVLSFQSADATSEWAAGFSSNPAASPSDTNLAFGFLSPGAGALQIIEAGVVIGAFGAFVVGDTFVIDFDGVNMLYMHNGVILRVTPHTGSLAPQFCLYTVGASLIDIALFVS